MKKELWLCGQLRGEWNPKGSVWDFQGVFDSEAKAVAACVNKNFFIFPVTLNKALPRRKLYPVGARYPKAVKA